MQHIYMAYQCLCKKYVYTRRSPDPLKKKADLSRSVAVLGGGEHGCGGGGGERRRAAASRMKINVQVQICDIIS